MEPRYQPLALPPLRRRGRQFAAVACALLLVTSCSDDSELNLAHVRSTTGTVTVRTSEDASPLPAKPDHALRDGFLVTTSEASTAEIHFVGGNVLNLEENTTLVIRPTGSASAEVGAVILEGAAKASSRGLGVLLSVGTPFGFTDLGGSEASLQVDAAKGFGVLVGAVTITTEDGTTTALEAGSGLNVEGIVVPVNELMLEEISVDVDPDALDLDPMTVVLLASNPRQVQVKRSGKEKFQAVKKRDVLENGDAVKTRRTANTRMQLGEQGDVTLGSGTELELKEAALGEQAHKASYILNDGTAYVNINRKPGVSATHSMTASDAKLQIKPGTRDASVQVNTNQKTKETDVLVRFGSVTLEDGTVVEAGSRVRMKDGKLVGDVLPVAPTNVDLRFRSNAIVYYERNVPPVALTWKEDGANKFEVQIARDRNFSKVVHEASLSKPRFVMDRLGAGRYYWRVRPKSGGEWSKSSLSIVKGSSSGGCKNCKRNNVINNTGEKTVVYFQEALPNITLRWKPKTDAAQYQVKVFQDSEDGFDKPMLDKTVQETQLQLTSGRVKEGKYFWLVIAQDNAGKELTTSPRMNSLELAYDNAVTDLSVRSPRNGSRVRGSKVTTSGEIQLGARLSINGKSVRVDSKGRFSQSVALDKGLNRLVYRTLARDGIERYYVREVVRR